MNFLYNNYCVACVLVAVFIRLKYMTNDRPLFQRISQLPEGPD